MWQFQNAGRGPDLRILRATGIGLIALTVASSVLIGISLAYSEQEVVVTEAKTLQQGAEAMFKAVDSNVARRHQFSLD